ncbi:MAG TPA: DUF434 domain-containing protein [Erysipelotrichaceae bacterium]|nr:DUF434 domain-containing protein [Erysipelotrichaceae bacterium]
MHLYHRFKIRKIVGNHFGINSDDTRQALTRYVFSFAFSHRR